MTGHRVLQRQPSAGKQPATRPATRVSQRRPQNGAPPEGVADDFNQDKIWHRRFPGEFKLRHGEYTAYVIRVRLPPSMDTYWTFSIIRLRTRDLLAVDHFFPVAHGHRQTLQAAKQAVQRLLSSLDAVRVPAGSNGKPAP